MIKGALLFPVILSLLALSIVGRVCAQAPILGVVLVALLAAAAYGGIRLYRDQRRHRFLRRAALAGGAAGALLALAVIAFSLIQYDYARFEDWHAGGADLRPGMSLDEARAALARGGVVTEFGVDEDPSFKGKRFQVEPTGLASYAFSFPLAELYYLDVQVDAAGTVAAVKAWHD